VSINQQVAAGVEKAFAIMDDYVSDGEYTVVNGAAVYDAALDKTLTPRLTLSPVRMLRTQLQTEEREASALAVTDIKVLIPGVDLGAVVPSETDSFKLDGAEYNVATFKPVPGNSLWIVFGRQK
jgi:hypothetical protein